MRYSHPDRTVHPATAAGLAAMRLLATTLMHRLPRARRHLQHFLDASGTSVTINLTQLLRDDPGVRALAFRTMAAQLQRGQTAGRLAAPQVMFKNTDWRWATGSLVLHWRQVGDQIQLHCCDRYHFQRHTGRISSPVHRLAVWLESQGAAAAFDMVGRAVVSVEAVHSEATPVVQYKRLYL